VTPRAAAAGDRVRFAPPTWAEIAPWRAPRLLRTILPTPRRRIARRRCERILLAARDGHPRAAARCAFLSPSMAMQFVEHHARVNRACKKF